MTSLIEKVKSAQKAALEGMIGEPAHAPADVEVVAAIQVVLREMYAHADIIPTTSDIGLLDSFCRRYNIDLTEPKS